MNLLIPLLYIISLYGAYLAGSLSLRTRSTDSVNETHGASKRRPYITLLVALVIAIPSILKFFFPSILQLFERNYAKFIAGEWWRLVTTLFVQDGGISGTIFNLVSLLLIGTVAERLWGSRRWLIIFFIGGILSQFIGFLWQPVGAGNSVANFALAASIAVRSLGFNSSRTVRLAAILALGAGGILALLKDIHGFATILGAVTAFLLIRLDPHSL